MALINHDLARQLVLETEGWRDGEIQGKRERGEYNIFRHGYFSFRDARDLQTRPDVIRRRSKQREREGGWTKKTKNVPQPCWLLRD